MLLPIIEHYSLQITEIIIGCGVNKKDASGSGQQPCALDESNLRPQSLWLATTKTHSKNAQVH